MSRISPSAERFDGVAPSPDYMLRDQALMSAAKNYFAWQARLVLPRLGLRVLEIGCGAGNFTACLMDRELVVALDHEPRMLERLRERFPNAQNLRTVLAEADDEDSVSQLAILELDSCVCMNVLEHVRDDVAALRAMARTIRPGAPIVLIVPAFPALYGPVDRNLGHFRRYTRTSLAATAHNARLAVEEMHYLNAAGLFGWWLNAHVLKRDAQSAAQIALFDRWIVPSAARLESIFGAPFGQSLFAVLSSA